MTIPKWRATCVQMKGLRAATASDRDEAKAIITKNLQLLESLVRDACAAPERPDLVLFPEFALQGPPLDLPVEDWIALACSAIPGALTEPLQALARELGIFIAGNMFEADPAWPGRYFNTSLLINRSGEILLRYKRINTAAFPSPHDFMDDYVRHVEQSGVFPVADTELGRLCLIPCAEINVPEVARVYMMQGAEVILHPTNSRHTTMQEATKVARAAENMMYLVSANVAGPIGFAHDATELGGRSHILDYRGDTLAFEEGAEQGISVSSWIDIEALRRDRRTDTGIYNPLIRNRFEMYRPYYDTATCYPPNSFLDRPMTNTTETKAALSAAIVNMESTGVLQSTNSQD
jgi:predicted amidohydrolase